MSSTRFPRSFFFFFFFWGGGGGGVGRYDKTLLNYWSPGKQQVMFPLDLNVSPGFVSRNIESPVETKLLFPWGQHKFERNKMTVNDEDGY